MNVASLLGRPVVRLLIAAIVLAAGVQSAKGVGDLKRRASAAELEAGRIGARAEELKRIASVTVELARSFPPGADLVPEIQRLATDHGIGLASTQASGVAELENGFAEEKFSIRLKAVPLGSALRLLAAIETSLPAARIGDLQIVRAVSGGDLVDVDFVVGNGIVQ